LRLLILQLQRQRCSRLEHLKWETIIFNCYVFVKF
jgi:hypothetical protein